MRTKGKKREQLLTVADLERHTGISRWTWYRWTGEGKIPYVQLGRLKRFRPADIEKFIAKNRHTATKDLGKGGSYE